MDWVKLTTDYYRDLLIAVGDDAAEVMFTRGIALVGEIESGGFIPDAMLHTLTRKPAKAPQIAAYLASGTNPIWERVAGGYQIINWDEIQAELERLVARKKADKLRKRASRAASKDESSPASADSPADSHEESLYESESKSQRKTAAAAAAALPTSIDILRSKLRAVTALRALRFDRLKPETAGQLERLIEMHGDQVLVDVALRTCRTPPPVHVSAFIGTWAALPEPGQRLKLVDEPVCQIHRAQGDPASRCRYCAADRLAGDA